MTDDIQPDEPFLDSVDGEVHLFRAIAEARPIGINAHFHVLHIWLSVQKETQQKITVRDVWKKLRTLYDIDALNAIDLEAASYEYPSTPSAAVLIPFPSPEDNLHSHPFFREEYSLSSLPYDEYIENQIISRRIRATPSVATPSPSPQPAAPLPKRARPKGKGRKTKQLKDAGLVGGESDSSALTVESGEENAVTPRESVFTGTDAGTEVEDEDMDTPEVEPAPTKKVPRTAKATAAKKNAAKTRAATAAKKKKRK